MRRVVGDAAQKGGTLTIDGLIMATKDDRPDEDELDRVTRRVLLAMLEERRTRQVG